MDRHSGPSVVRPERVQSIGIRLEATGHRWTTLELMCGLCAFSIRTSRAKQSLSSAIDATWRLLSPLTSAERALEPRRASLYEAGARDGSQPSETVAICCIRLNPELHIPNQAHVRARDCV